VEDNPHCYSPATFGSSPRCDSVTKTVTFTTETTNNYNQVLLIDNQRQFLVTCGSVFQVLHIVSSSEREGIIGKDPEEIHKNVDSIKG